jgi:hypothetical protein
MEFNKRADLRRKQKEELKRRLEMAGTSIRKIRRETGAKPISLSKQVGLVNSVMDIIKAAKKTEMLAKKVKEETDGRAIEPKITYLDETSRSN